MVSTICTSVCPNETPIGVGCRIGSISGGFGRVFYVSAPTLTPISGVRLTTFPETKDGGGTGGQVRGFCAFCVKLCGSFSATTATPFWAAPRGCLPSCFGKVGFALVVSANFSLCAANFGLATTATKTNSVWF